MQKTAKELAELLNGELIGDATVIISSAAGIKEAGKDDITFLANPRYASLLETTSAGVVITGKDSSSFNKTLIRTENPSFAFAQVLNILMPHTQHHPSGIHPTAVVSPSATLGKNVGIGAHAVIDEHAVIGDNSIIYAGCFIGRSTRVGNDVLIYPNVTIREDVVIGNRVIIHSSTVIGSDGFGFATVKGVHHKIPQVGSVLICDDVEIGSNVSIDRARLDKTIIGKGTKIDNLVQIAHNVVVGENSLIVAQAGISGSTVIGNSVTLAGQAGLVGHINVGDNAIVAAQAGVTKSVEANTMVSGYPARVHETALKVNACVQSLPKLYDTIRELKKRIEVLERLLNEKK